MLPCTSCPVGLPAASPSASTGPVSVTASPSLPFLSRPDSLYVTAALPPLQLGLRRPPTAVLTAWQFGLAVLVLIAAASVAEPASQVVARPAVPL